MSVNSSTNSLILYLHLKFISNKLYISVDLSQSTNDSKFEADFLGLSWLSFDIIFYLSSFTDLGTSASNSLKHWSLSFIRSFMDFNKSSISES